MANKRCSLHRQKKPKVFNRLRFINNFLLLRLLFELEAAAATTVARSSEGVACSLPNRLIGLEPDYLIGCARVCVSARVCEDDVDTIWIMRRAVHVIASGCLQLIPI